MDNDGDLDIVSLSSQGARLFKSQWGSRKTSRDCGFADPVPLSDNIAPAVSYQIASADFDNDGDIDLLVSYADTTKAGALLLRNEGGEKNGYLKVHLKGLNSNKDGIGAKVEIKAGGLSQKLELRGDRNGRTVHFGIGSRKKIDFVRDPLAGWSQTNRTGSGTRLAPLVRGIGQEGHIVSYRLRLERC